MLWWLAVKVFGVFLILIGGFLVIFFPALPDHQNIKGQTGFSMDVVGVLVGIILLIIGGFLLFS